MEEVNLQEMLAARERRCYLQTQLLHQYKKSLISFTLNIQDQSKSCRVFRKHCNRLSENRDTVKKDRLVLIQHMETIKEKTGYEAFYSVDANPDFIKELMVSLEDQDRIGRLFDIDVLRPDGKQGLQRGYGGARQEPACSADSRPMYAAAAADTALRS